MDRDPQDEATLSKETTSGPPAWWFAFFENKVSWKRGAPRSLRTRAWLSYQECMVDALVSRADEGRGIAAKSFGEPLSGL